MKLTIFGATGGTGTCLTEQALAAGHSVTAVVRDPARLAVPAHQRLRTTPSSKAGTGARTGTATLRSTVSVWQKLPQACLFCHAAVAGPA